MTKLTLMHLHAAFTTPGRLHPGRRGTPHGSQTGTFYGYEGHTIRYPIPRIRKRNLLLELAEGKPVTEKVRRELNKRIKAARHQAITARRQKNEQS